MTVALAEGRLCLADAGVRFGTLRGFLSRRKILGVAAALFVGYRNAEGTSGLRASLPSFLLPRAVVSRSAPLGATYAIHPFGNGRCRDVKPTKVASFGQRGEAYC